MDYGGYGSYGGRSFVQAYHCYPMSLINKPHLENGDKATLHIDYPMLFELHNTSEDRVSHCGVMEFTAEEGTIYLPNWMMQNLHLQEGNIIQIKNATLPKGSYLKLQPHTGDFLDISDPKAILEITLRFFSCLTTGDTIMVTYNNKKFYIDVVETKPVNAICIIETDCEVDFALPLDYKEPEKEASSTTSRKAPAQVQEVAAEVESKFNPFTGLGRRLDGKPLAPSLASASSASKQSQHVSAIVAGSTAMSDSSPLPSRKLVFGSKTCKASDLKETEKVSAKADTKPQKEEEPKFKAFTGRKYSLKG